MAKLPVTPSFINGAWLVYTKEGEDSETYLPLSKFRVSYAENTIPSAQVYPSIGFNLKSPKQVASVTGLSENMQVRIDFRKDGVTQTLLEGFAASITVAETSTAFKRRASVVIHVQHNIVRLAGAAPATFGYQSQHIVSLQTLYAFPKTVLFTPADGEAPTGLDPSNVFIDIMLKSLGSAAPLYPSAVLKATAEKIAENWGQYKGLADPSNLIRAYDPANLAQLKIAGVPVAKHISSVFSQAFPNSNAWEALVRTARSMFLSVIPFNKGVYIGNPSSLIRDPDIYLSANEYTELTDSEDISAKEPVDGIAVLNPILRSANINTAMAVFPRIVDPETGETDAISYIPAVGKYYHFREFPSWLADMSNARYGEPNEGKITESNPGAAAPDRRPVLAPEDYLTLAERLAKAYYSQARVNKKMIGVVLPYRTDLMPGTITALQKPVSRGDYFVTEDIYGHIKETVFEGSMLEGSGSLITRITISAARTATDNNNDSLTFVSHPIYQGKWAGIDLNGDLLPGVEVPTHTPLVLPPDTSFNSGTAKQQ